MINQQELKELLHYDRDTGVFRWRFALSSKVKPWGIAGTKYKGGYIHIRLHGKAYAAHRLAWLYVYGELPESYLDHIDGTPDNNRIENLRPVTNKQNQENRKQDSNSTTGFRGVTFHKGAGKYQAQVVHNGKHIYCGLFATPEMAADAARATRARVFTHDEGRAA